LVGSAFGDALAWRNIRIGSGSCPVANFGISGTEIRALLSQH